MRIEAIVYWKKLKGDTVRSAKLPMLEVVEEEEAPARNLITIMKSSFFDDSFHELTLHPLLEFLQT
jgi:hypothetical protein